MKKQMFLFAAAAVLAFASCEKPDITGDVYSDDLSRLKSSSQSSNEIKGQRVLNFRAHLSSDQEVPQNGSKTTGQAIFQLSKDGMNLKYKVIVANIENVTMAHIHLAPAGSNGPVVAWLYPPRPPAMLKPGTTNGILQQGTLTKANLAGSLAGKELKDLVDLIIAGNTYVNVHTSQFPGGEIRGQIWGNVPGE